MCCSVPIGECTHQLLQSSAVPLTNCVLHIVLFSCFLCNHPFLGALFSSIDRSSLILNL